MKSKKRPLGFVVILALGLALVLVSGFTQPARAASEDVAMFYDDLSQYGQWVDYENYGPVWRPSGVEEDWRPYTDGRWVPTNDGYVFESQEPWGWATYHYGNWMPTPGYGWVWSPGRTWYPSTVEWRTSPETAPVDSSYVGWAPIPPPNYVPAQAYAPPTGYYPGAPVSNLLTEPLWIFVRAASFLLGFGQPYAPGYSYGGCGCLAPPSYVPVFFPQTVFVPTYYAPSYYPQTYFGGGYAGAYSWGPPVNYISRVTNINQTVINQTINNNTVNITRIHNVVAPTNVINRNTWIRNIQPPALTQGRPLPPGRPMANIQQARANLSKPNLIRPPQNVPPLRAQIPKAPPLAAQPVRGGVPGAMLPARATMQLSPQQQAQVQRLPANRQINPVRPTLVGGQPGRPVGPAGVQGQPGQVQPGAAPRAGTFQPGGKPGQVQPGGIQRPGAMPPSGMARPGASPAVPGHPGAATPAVTPSGRPRQAPPGVTPGGATPAVPGRPGPTTPAIPPSGRPGGRFTPSQPQQVTPQAQPQMAPRAQPQVQPRPQPQVMPTRPQPTPAPQRPQFQAPQQAPRPTPQAAPQPRPQPQFQAPRPQPQAQPRPQPQFQAPRPAPQPAPRVAPAPHPAPAPAPQHAAPAPRSAAPAPAPAKQQPQQQQQKKPDEH